MNYTLIFILYCVAMLAIGVIGYKKDKKSILNFNLAEKKLKWLPASFSIAATWIWAPALFVASERAYVDGLIGFAWFLVPNVLSLVLFGYIATKAMRKSKDEHTVAELIGDIYHSKRLKFLHDFELLVLLFCSTGVQLLAGGLALVLLTGINFIWATIIMALVSLSYSLVRGLKASVNTDFIKMVILLATILVAGYVFLQGGALHFGGIKNMTINPFSDYGWKIFMLFGINTTIGLLAGPVGDQTFWQRAFAMDRRDVMRSFGLSALIFAVVPIATGLIGFVAASAGFIPHNVSMVGLEFVKSVAPSGLVILFMLAILSGLMSTIDSNMCAMGTITSKWFSRERTIMSARLGMILVTIFGLAVANIPNINIFWLFLFYGVFRSSVFIPTLFTMVAKRLPKESAVFYGMLGAFLIAVPIYAYGAINKIADAKFWGTILTILIPLFVILISNLITLWTTRKRA